MHKVGSVAFVVGVLVYAAIFGVGLFISETLMKGLTNRASGMVATLRRPK